MQNWVGILSAPRKGMATVPGVTEIKVRPGSAGVPCAFGVQLGRLYGAGWIDPLAGRS
jgi:hypothetical protein